MEEDQKCSGPYLEISFEVFGWLKFLGEVGGDKRRQGALGGQDDGRSASWQDKADISEVNKSQPCLPPPGSRSR